MSLSTVHIPEPLLAFAHGQKLEAPKDGLFLFGPVEDAGGRSQVRIGVIGTATGVGLSRRWLARLSGWIAGKTDKQGAPVLWAPAWPGFEACFGVGLPSQGLAELAIDGPGIEAAIKKENRSDAVRSTVRLFAEVHRAAIREIAVADYPAEVIGAWAPLVMEDDVERILANRDGEVRLVAEIEGRIVGLGAIVPQNSELRACYVAPEAARHGVGTAIVRDLERIACEHRLTFPELDSSLTAKPFYRSLGYVSQGRITHRLDSGQPMASVKESCRCNLVCGHPSYPQTDGRRTRSGGCATLSATGPIADSSQRERPAC